MVSSAITIHKWKFNACWNDLVLIASKFVIFSEYEKPCTRFFLHSLLLTLFWHRPGHSIAKKKFHKKEKKLIPQAISYFCTFGISKKNTEHFDNCIKTSVFYLFRYYSAFSTFLARITALSVAKKSFFNQIYKGTLCNKISPLVQYTNCLEIAFQ